MSKKINLEEIILDIYGCQNVEDFQKSFDISIKMTKDICKQACKQILELAAENAISEFWGMCDYHGDHDSFGLDEEGCYKTYYTNEDGNNVELSFHFDKQSILNTINQIE